MKLTKRQSQIITMIASGQGDKQIAAEINISVRTVNFHVCELLKRLKVKNRAQAVREFFR
jgi:DNA-binding NarL/FixJ family response regulator